MDINALSTLNSNLINVREVPTNPENHWWERWARNVIKKQHEAREGIEQGMLENEEDSVISYKGMEEGKKADTDKGDTMFDQSVAHRG